MNRRRFIANATAATVGVSAGGVATVMGGGGDTGSKPRVRFGLVADPHFARPATGRTGSRFYADSAEKLREAIRVFNARKLDFVVELGDFKDMDPKPDRRRALAYLEEIESILRTFHGPVFHVLGNHDQDCISKDDFLARTCNGAGTGDGKTFYAFAVGGVKFVVLDANFRPDGVPYANGNFDWREAFVPAHELRWLRAELDCAAPVVVLAHQRLDKFHARTAFDRALVVRNAAEVRAVLERNGNVLVVFQGHDHRGALTKTNGIHYYTQRGMIEGAYPQNNSFSIGEIFADGRVRVTGFRNAVSCELSRSTGGGHARWKEKAAAVVAVASGCR